VAGAVYQGGFPTRAEAEMYLARAPAVTLPAAMSPGRARRTEPQFPQQDPAFQQQEQPRQTPLQQTAPHMQHHYSGQQPSSDPSQPPHYPTPEPPYPMPSPYSNRPDYYPPQQEQALGGTEFLNQDSTQAKATPPTDQLPLPSSLEEEAPQHTSLRGLDTTSSRGPRGEVAMELHPGRRQVLALVVVLLSLLLGPMGAEILPFPPTAPTICPADWSEQILRQEPRDNCGEYRRMKI
jgi:hypothetical protein